jgi:holo-[acyl-carrier protein] synthase
MIIGIGTDIVELKRIEGLLQKFGEKFCARIFTKLENERAQKIDVAANKIRYYAKRFAAKEAFSKACGTGIGRGLDFCDIEIDNDSLGKPFIRVLNGKNVFLKENFGCDDIFFHLSLSDEKLLAQAFVVIEK